ncbi:MAG: DUF1559 domain-containing protein, partial [Verrucomicrobia subdivision 3 bacterium]|nr:DUF1559 domain-containing protein [Limisphaerales bacterium]
MTLLEVVVAIAIIGILMALLLPAVQYAREVARRATCGSKLRQIGLALHSYEAALRTYPSGAITSRDSSPTSNCAVGGNANQDSFAPWTVLLLPHLEDDARHQNFRCERAFFGLYHAMAPAPNDAEQLRRCSIWECPSDPNSGIGNANCNYFGVQGGGNVPSCGGSSGYAGRVFFYNGIFHNNSRITAADIADGTSNTMAVGESRYLQL